MRGERRREARMFPRRRRRAWIGRRAATAPAALCAASARSSKVTASREEGLDVRQHLGRLLLVRKQPRARDLDEAAAVAELRDHGARLIDGEEAIAIAPH